MARRTAKNSNRLRNKEKVSPDSMEPQVSGKPAEGSSRFKYIFIIVILAVLADLYGPNLMKKGVEPKGNFFLIKKIGEFNGSETLGQSMFANDIVAVTSHELAITDNLNGQVLIYDFKGKLIRKWGKNGAGPREFREPSGIATDGKGHIFVMDTMNNAIKTFDLEGKFIHALELNKYGYFATPRRLGWGGNSFLVANTADARLARLSPAGEMLSTWGEKGAGNGGLWGTSKPISDGKGHFYIGESNMKDSRVRVYDESGKVVQEIKTGIPADTLALDSKGRLFVGSYGEPSKIFDSNGNSLGSLAEESQPETPLNQITGMDILPGGILLTCGGNTVVIYQLIEDKAK